MRGFESAELVGTAIAALLFGMTFLLRLGSYSWRFRFKSHRAVLSFGAGMSIAYVFVHMIPSLNEARLSFVESVSFPLIYEGMAIYFLSLLGFLVFYGIDQQVDLEYARTSQGKAGLAFGLHIGGFSLYVWLVSYLLLHQLGGSPVSTPLYALAMVIHFLALDYTLRHKHATGYDRFGRFMLAGAAGLGWLCGLLFSIPPAILALLVAFISGAIIMTSTVMELSPGAESRYRPVVYGGVIYGLLLVTLG